MTHMNLVIVCQKCMLLGSYIGKLMDLADITDRIKICMHTLIMVEVVVVYIHLCVSVM